MKVAWKRNSHDWIKALLQRAKYLNRNRFGSWEDAVKKLGKLEEGDFNWPESGTLSQEPILGYPCGVSKYLKDDKISQQWAVIFHPKGYVSIKYFIKNALPTF